MLPNAVAWVGEEVGGEGALHMLCKVSLLPLLVSTFACNFFKLKRASRSHAKTGLNPSREGHLWETLGELL